MNQELGLRLLANLLGWNNAEATTEYRWLRFMSRYKYDGYQDFVAGKRFIGSLISWLKQFASQEERRAAYSFIRRRLVYLGPAEMNHLVRLTYPEAIRPRLARTISSRLGIPEYLIWAHPDGARAFRKLLRASLFFALSDGARIDAFRRANAGLISNEQVLIATQVHDNKWASVLKQLEVEEGIGSRFEYVFLLDDFTASGATLIRFDSDQGEWKGKLVRFWEEAEPHVASHFAEGWTLNVHHYVASAAAKANVEKREAERRATASDPWFRAVNFSYGLVLPSELALTDPQDAGFLALADQYYDPVLETKHTDVGGSNVARGFGMCALPIVLDHNTPNNSMALLWAETEGGEGIHAMRPLFRRRQRHV